MAIKMTKTTATNWKALVDLYACVNTKLVSLGAREFNISLQLNARCNSFYLICKHDLQLELQNVTFIWILPDSQEYHHSYWKLVFPTVKVCLPRRDICSWERHTQKNHLKFQSKDFEGDTFYTHALLQPLPRTPSVVCFMSNCPPTLWLHLLGY